MNGELLQGSLIPSESIGITQYLSPHTPGSSISPDGLEDALVTRGRSTDRKESIEVLSQSES